MWQKVSYYGGQFDTVEEHGTAHLSVVDTLPSLTKVPDNSWVLNAIASLEFTIVDGNRDDPCTPNCPPQDCPPCRQSWGGQAWVLQQAIRWRPMGTRLLSPPPSTRFMIISSSWPSPIINKIEIHNHHLNSSELWLWTDVYINWNSLQWPSITKMLDIDKTMHRERF